MLELILIGVATGIVARLAKNKRRDPVLFGFLTAAAALIGAFVGADFIGVAGEILGTFVGGVILEEVTRNMPEKPDPKSRYFVRTVVSNRIGR